MPDDSVKISSNLIRLTPNEIECIDGIRKSSEKVAKLVEYTLIKLGSSKDQPKYSTEIISVARDLYPVIFDSIAEGTFRNYLNGSPAINSRIISLGVAKGYYLDQDEKNLVLEDILEDPSPNSTADLANSEAGPRPYLQKERRLYTHIVDWLQANGYRSDVVSNGRLLGPWGNPDVVGIKTLDIIGTWQAQTLSVEVKVNNKTWQRDIFEAISHRRYFDRCYFCYPVLANNRQISQELKDYAELYSVGILLVEMPEEELEKLNRAEELDPNNLSITEACPAPYFPVMPEYRKMAFDALGISGLDSLFGWGKPAN